MTIAAFLRAGGRLLVDRPTDILPVYLLATGLLLTAQVPVLVAGGAIAYLLIRSGALERLIAELEAVDPGTFDPANPGAAEGIPPGLEAALLDVFTPAVVALFVLGIFASTIVGIVARGVSAAATLSAVYAALDGGDGVRAAVDGMADRWQSFVALAFVRFGLFLIAIVPLAVSIYITLVFASPIGLLLIVLSLVVGAAIGLLAILGLAFAGQAIVIDDVGVFGGIRRGFGLIINRPAAFGGYLLVAIAILAVSGTLSAIFGLLGVSQVTGLAGPLVLLPFTDAFKTALYADRTETPIDRPATSDRVIAAFGGGVRSLGGFIRDHPIANLAALGVFAGGVAFGLSLTAGTSIPFEGPENIGEVFGTFPVGTFVSLSINNWLVAAGAAFGGIVVGVPTIVSLLFNGALVGGIFGISDPLVFYALVAPHGIIELPAIFVACGAGFHLASVTIGAARGKRPREDLNTALRLVYRVLLGLAIVFVIAGFIEAFLTPFIAEVVLTGR
ncbi:stage II sporulation protein M [Halalkalirubrum salinum]|uniref:stage II sporulation protein M n=1 Tax=Halalkalirubrum salinum TaxID=2563889 RepID=UPI001484CFF9|nr:stage II sporulation protein M [Halalkalirubrum salinum]